MLLNMYTMVLNCGVKDETYCSTNTLHLNIALQSTFNFMQVERLNNIPKVLGTLPNTKRHFIESMYIASLIHKVSYIFSKSTLSVLRHIVKLNNIFQRNEILATGKISNIRKWEILKQNRHGNIFNKLKMNFMPQMLKNMPNVQSKSKSKSDLTSQSNEVDLEILMNNKVNIGIAAIFIMDCRNSPHFNHRLKCNLHIFLAIFVRCFHQSCFSFGSINVANIHEIIANIKM